MRVFKMILFLISLPAFSMTEVVTKIHDIDYGQKPGDEVLVFLENGHVAKVRQSDSFFSSKSNLKSMKNNWYAIEMDDERFITNLTPVEPQTSQPFVSENKSMQEYVPTTIASMDLAKKYFREGRYNPKDSQCFNRATVWVYEWWRNHSLKSKKLFIYFTRTYIRKYNFEWWFHVAPLVNVMDNGKVVERMLDVKYQSRPLAIRDWSNLFMRNDAPCRVITKYSDYADYPYTGDCYIQRASMYYHQPADLQMNEAWGYNKENFLMNEVREAYREAYDEII